MNLNLRSLNKTVDGIYSLIPSTKDHVNRNLCLHCSDKNCLVPYANKQAAKSVGGAVITTKCEKFRPPIGFQDPDGIEGSRNTLRLGGAWFDRVSVGQEVGLVSTKTGSLFGLATIGGKMMGPPSYILDSHAKYNHVFTGRRITKKKASEEMRAMMPKIYGPMIWNNCEKMVAIYFNKVRLFSEDRNEKIT